MSKKKNSVGTCRWLPSVRCVGSLPKSVPPHPPPRACYLRRSMSSLSASMYIYIMPRRTHHIISRRDHSKQYSPWRPKPSPNPLPPPFPHPPSQKVKQYGDQISTKVCVMYRQTRIECPNTGVLGEGTVLCLERDAWSMPK